MLLYYKGFELSVDGRFRLATIDYCRFRDGRLEVDAERLGRAPEEAVLGSERLQSTFRRVRGAHLVFLDVRSATGRPRQKVAQDPELGILRVVDGRPLDPRAPPVVLAGIRSAARSGDGRLRTVRDQVRQAAEERPGLVFDDGLPPPLLELELIQP